MYLISPIARISCANQLLLQKQGRAYGLSRGCPTDDAGTAIISSDTPITSLHGRAARYGLGNMGFLVDPNITAMPDRIAGQGFQSWV